MSQTLRLGSRRTAHPGLVEILAPPSASRERLQHYPSSPPQVGHCTAEVGQNIHVVNEYDEQYGNSGTTAITGGLYFPRGDPAWAPTASSTTATRGTAAPGAATA